MSKKERVVFFCKQCGHESSRWEGKCPACGEWDALVEAPAEKPVKASGKRDRSAPLRVATLTGASQLKPLKEHARERLPRVAVPIGEFHRVLGGGIVPGGSVLVGGEPGIGKSTLLLQLLGALITGAEKHNPPQSLVYITGEEAPSQIAARAERLHVEGAKGKKNGAGEAFASDLIKLASETDLETILALLENERPMVAVIDSIQTLRDAESNSAPGSISQVRDCAMALVDAGRRLNTTIFIIGHVTKEGSIAGPRVLEHVVDTVLNFEGDPHLGLRVLRSSKNRFGSTDEVGFFEMGATGLEEVPDPSVVLLDRDGAADKGAGSAIGALCEGSRILLVELQGLTVPVPGGGSPRRRASGLDANRLAQILAVLETKASVPYGALDVFASAAGGFRVEEPDADLPLALALASVATGRPVRDGLVVAGEVGLGGEIRPIPRMEARIAEARRLGFQQILLPARGRTAAPLSGNGIKLLRARTIREALALGLG